jgi:hypothetical protein
VVPRSLTCPRKREPGLRELSPREGLPLDEIEVPARVDEASRNGGGHSLTTT